MIAKKNIYFLLQFYVYENSTECVKEKVIYSLDSLVRKISKKNPAFYASCVVLNYLQPGISNIYMSWQYVIYGWQNGIYG